MATQTKNSDVMREIEEAFGQVPSWIREIPEAGLTGFWGMFRDFYLAETKVPNKYKELIGIAVSGATRCKYCVLFHTEAAKLYGATDDEIAEAALMGGVTMIGSTFINAMGTDYETFAKETREIVAHVKASAAQKGNGDRAGKESHARARA